MNPVRKPTWQQATALVSLSTCGAMTGFSFAHGTVEDMTSPTRIPVHLMEFKKPARPVSANDGALRSAIVNVASYYLRMAQSKPGSTDDIEGWQPFSQVRALLSLPGSCTYQVQSSTAPIRVLTCLNTDKPEKASVDRG